MSTTLNIGELLNLTGLSTGVVLYVMLLVMVLRPGGARGYAGVDPLLLLTAVLGLVWNLCALPVYELPKMGVTGPFPFVAAVGFSALGFLPAVVVHSVLRGEHHNVRGPFKRALAGMAYAASASAAVLHFGAAISGAAVPASFGMRLLTYTFIAMALPLAAATRGQPGSRRALWAAALAIFAVSALHLSQLHQGSPSWPVELVGHHASLPLALAILYQDFPFALADLFLKRALSLLAIVSLAFAAVTTLGMASPAFAGFLDVNPTEVSLLITLWVATALFYPSLRRVTSWFVDAIVLRRPDYPSLRSAIARTVQAHDNIPALLNEVCDRLAPALNAPRVTWQEWPSRDDEALGPVVVGAAETRAVVNAALKSAENDSTAAPSAPLAALVIIPTSDRPRFVIPIAQLTQGRRLLSDDISTLEAISVTVARRIDAIRIADERFERGIREQEMAKLATEAELRALRAQINPHFLFNALTTIGYLIQTAPPRALQTLMRLTVLLRAVLRSEGNLTTLGRELELVESYLDIERARFEQRLQVTVDVPGDLKALRLPPLVLQPLVENAVKHGIAQQERGGEVTIRARIDRTSTSSPCLSLVVGDTGAGSTNEALRRGRATGVGLRNVERRLESQYGDAASLSIQTVAGRGTSVELRLPIELPVAGESDRQLVSK